MSSKRRGGGQDDDEPTPSRRRHRHAVAGRRKHLYLLLDDWNKGYSLHKIDPDTLELDAGAGAGHLPEPPVVRLDAPMGMGSISISDARMFLSALGTKIFVFMNHRCALVYDTETAAVSTGPHAPARMLCGSGVTVPAGGSLYALSHRFLDRDDPHSFHVMMQQQQQQQGSGWSWKTLPEPPPAFTIRQIVVSHALHPDGRTIFMTTADRGAPGEALGTYSFNTERSEWRHHGDWGLPFFGQGFFDGELDAWVGLHREGYVCCCQVPSRSQSQSQSQLDWQRTKEKLAYAYEDDDWDDDKYGDASLTYINDMNVTGSRGSGTGGQFCIVETMTQDGAEDQGYCLHEHELRFTMFGLKYDHDHHHRRGELRVTNRRSTRSYLVSRYKCSLFVPRALWI